MAITTDTVALRLAQRLVAHGVAIDDVEAFAEDFAPDLVEWLGGEGAVPAALATKVTTTATAWNTDVMQRLDWWTGPVDGGPNGDGLYPMTNAAGVTTLFPSLAKILSSTAKGDSAYDVAVSLGYAGTEEEYAEFPIVQGDYAQEKGDYALAKGNAAAAATAAANAARDGALFKVIVSTKAQLDVALGYIAGTIGIVRDDPTLLNNGIYSKAGGVGAGSWSKLDLYNGTPFQPMPVESGYILGVVDALARMILMVETDGTVVPTKFRLPAVSVLKSMLSAEVTGGLMDNGLPAVIKSMGPEQTGIYFTDAADKILASFDPDGSFFPRLLKLRAGSVEPGWFGPNSLPDGLVSLAKLGSDATSRMLGSVPDELGFPFVLVDGTDKILVSVDMDGAFHPRKLRLPTASVVRDALAADVISSLMPAGAGSRISTIPDESGYAFVVTDAADKILFGVPNVNLPIKGKVERAALADSATTALNVGAKKNITGLGDSLSAGAGSTGGQTYLAQLAADLGRAVTNMGIGGQGSAAIVARQGGDPSLLTVTGNLIPASGGVAVTSRSISLLTSQGAQSLTGVLAGVAGTLTRASDDTYSFTRTTAGNQRVCPALTPFVPDLGVLHQDDIWSIWSGRNDGGSALATTTKAKVAAAVAWIPHDQWVVVGVITSTAETVGTSNYGYITAYNNDQAAKYGSRFVDVRRYLIDNGLQALADAGITPTATDIDNVNNQDTLPPSITSDGLHLTNVGYRLVKDAVKAVILAKGW